MYFREINPLLTWLLLAFCALLEVGGDALVRLGLHEPHSPLRRGTILLSGALVLFAYGFLVNTLRWDFGKMLGVYVALFFLIAQAVAWIGFGEKPTLPIMVGGSFIVGGACIIQWWKV